MSRESFSDEELARTRVILASDSQRRARIKNLRTKMGFIARCVKTVDELNARYADAVRRPLATVPYTDAARRRVVASAGALTPHKLQGRTLHKDRLVLSIRPRACLPSLNLGPLYVALTRNVDPSDVAILCPHR